MSRHAPPELGALKWQLGQEKRKDHAQQLCLLFLFLSTCDYPLWETVPGAGQTFDLILSGFS